MSWTNIRLLTFDHALVFLLEMSYPLGVDLHPDQPCMKQYCNFRPFLKNDFHGEGGVDPPARPETCLEF
jgi:hypothetical protein